MKPPPSTSRAASFIRILGSRIDTLPLSSVLAETASYLRSDRPHYLLTANALMILEAKKSAAYRSALEKASLSVADSSGITWAAQFLGLPKVQRIPGIDLALQLCGQAAQLKAPIYFLGGKPGVAARAAAFIKVRYPTLEIAGTRHGYFLPSDDLHVIEEIKTSAAKLVCLAMGMPRQEEWFAAHYAHLPPALYVGIGGTFDVWAGDLRRAPVWFQKRGLEWLYRVAQEPFRLKRIAKLPLFAGYVVGERLKRAKIPLE